MTTTSSDPVTRRHVQDLTDSLSRLRALIAPRRASDARPRRSQRQIVLDMQAACRAGQAACGGRNKNQARDAATVPTRPVNRPVPIDARAAEAQRQTKLCVAWDSELKAAGEKMRAAFRPTA